MFDYTDKSDSITNYFVNTDIFSKYGQAPWTTAKFDSPKFTYNNSKKTEESPSTKFDKFLKYFQNYLSNKNLEKGKSTEEQDKEEEEKDFVQQQKIQEGIDSKIQELALSNLLYPNTETQSFQYVVDYNDEDYRKMSLEEILDVANLKPYVRITSGFRPGAKTKRGTPSNHSKKNEFGNPRAYDIAPVKGFSFDDLVRIFKNNNIFKNWLKANKFNINSEVGAQWKKITGSTGDHFHIGLDTFNVVSID